MNPRYAVMTCKAWTPAFAGVTSIKKEVVMPAKAGVQVLHVDSHLIA
jgi:hypothetical protein